MLNRRQYQLGDRGAARAATPLIALAALFSAALLITTPRAAQATPPLGINLDWNYDWAPQQMFTDIVKQARGWDAIGVANQGLDNATRDANNWPTQDFGVIGISEPAGAADWSNGGAYSITFTGQAVIADEGGVGATVTNQVYNSGTNTTTATFNAPTGARFIWITFTSTQRTPGGAAGLTGLRIIRPGYAADGSVVFTTPFTTAISKFGWFRTMNAVDGNSSCGNSWSPSINYPTTTDWTNRRSPAYPIQNTDEIPSGMDDRFVGVAWEHMIQLANACNTDIWINIPMPATDNYVTQLATLLKNGDTVNGVNYPALHSGGHVYVELSNEIWNGFYQGNYAQSWANALGLNRYQLVGMRTAQISNLFKAVWGAGAINTTIRVVVPGQHTNSGTYTTALDYIRTQFGTVNTFVYGLATAPYYMANATTNTIAAVETSLTNASNSDMQYRTGTYGDITEANAYGIVPCTYEGGPDLSQDSSAFSGNQAWPSQATLDQSARDSGMTSIVANDLTINWFNAGGGPYTFYEITNNYGGYENGDWGLSETINNISTAKWAGINQVLGSSGSPPAVPVMNAPTAGNAQVALSWTGNGSSYNVYRGTVSGGESGTAIASGVATTSYTDTGLTNGTAYYYNVKAVNSYGTSGASNEVSATPSATAPPAPTGLTATAGDTQVSLSWTASSGATSYNVLRSTVNGSGYASVITGLSTTSYTNTGLTDGTTYYFVVTATSTGGTSGNSNQASATPASSGGSNLALNKTATADASQTGNPPSYGNDGSTTTKWCAPDPNTGHWWKVDLGQSYALTSTTIIWEQNNAYKYKIEVSPDNSTWTTAVDKTGNTTAAQTMTDNFSATGRYVRLTITGGLSGGVWACFSEFQAYGGAGGSAPPAPTGLTATPGNAQVSLAWSASSGATSYNVLRSTVNGSGYASAATGIATTTYTNTGLANGTTYYFVVTATNASGTSGNSNQASATPQITAPPAPTGLTATAGNGQVALSWTASSGATSYDVLRSTVNGSGYASAMSGLSTTSYTNTGLTNGTTYYFVVVAANAGGMSGNSNQASATPATSGATNLALNKTATADSTQSGNVPANAVDGNGGSGDSSRWTANDGNFPHWWMVDLGASDTLTSSSIQFEGASVWKYKIDVSPDNSTWTNAVDRTANATSAQTFADTFSATGRYVRVTVTGSSGGFWASIFEVQVFGTVGGSAPPAPTGLTATSGNTQVALSWTASSGATSYSIYRGTTAGGESGTAIATGISTTSYTNTGLTNGTAYYYTVKAVNSVGTSGASNEASATPQLTVPAAPTGLTATPGNTQVALSWTASSGATSYNVYRGTTAGGESGTAIATGISTTSYTNTGLTNGTTYYFTVKAVNTAGTSGASNEASGAPTSGTNLVPDPGFESGQGGWYFSYTGTGVDPVISTAAAHSGTNGVSIGGNYANISQTITGLTPNTAYTLTMWGRLINSATGNNAALNVTAYGGSEIDTWVTTTTYTQYTLSFTTGASNTSAKIGFGFYTGSTCGAYCDDFNLH